MATSKKTVAKASKKTATAKKPTAKKATAPKKAAKAPAKKAPAKKPVKPVAKKVAAPKKAVKKVTAKKAAPAKKTVKKVEVVKKNVSTKKIVTKKTTSKTVTKKTTSPTKKATTPTKKATASAKKTTTAKKVAAPKKAVVTRPAPKKATVATASKKETNKKLTATEPAVAAKKTAKTPVKKIIKAPTTSAVASAPSRPSLSGISRAAREEKKSNVIVAHRKLENKSKKEEPVESVERFQPPTHSILAPVQQEETTGPVYRYNDEDLAEFKELILNRMEAARKELAYLQGLITRKDEAGTEDTENRYMNMEDGSGAMEREQLAQLASRQIQFIGHLEKALLRIENKTYGVCRVTGKLIDKARLRAVPHATLSIEAKMTMSK